MSITARPPDSNDLFVGRNERRRGERLELVHMNNVDDSFEKIEIGVLASRLRRKWAWVLLPVILFGGLAFAFSSTRTPSFQASARVLLTQSAAEEALSLGSDNAGILSRELSNEVSLAQSDAVLGRVDQLLADEGVERTPELSVAGVEGTDVLSFTASGNDREAVALGANGWANAYVDSKRADVVESINGAIDTLRVRLVELEERRRAIVDPDSFERVLLDSEVTVLASSITNLQLSSQLATSGTARIIDTAAPPTTATGISTAVLTAVGLIIGLGFGVGAALFAGNLDRTILDEDSLRTNFDLRLLGSIPRAARSDSDYVLANMVSDHPENPIAEAYRVLRSSLELSLVQHDIRTVLVTSANESEGKTTTSSNLAWASASAGQTTMVVDSDLRKPSIHSVLNLPLEPGITNVVSGDYEIRSATNDLYHPCLLYTSPSPRDKRQSRMPSSA